MSVRNFHSWRSFPEVCRRGTEMGKPAAGADPHAPVGVRKKRPGIAVVPNQPVLLIVVTPARAVVGVHAAIASVPDVPGMVHANEISFIGGQAVLLRKCTHGEPVAIHSDARDAVR